ncbi:MAG TPA: 3-hydroxyacyl-CoA dehydrogenase family protein [Bacteroidia bacterium]|nr:3-hydroxyacyl-CoA dehydrogenase family protein [Bacteroidia bacterium]HRS57960.1 3-hydroxyacyl-CoA dehydrogenase family protein [Bacteroidia bacterium]HRU68003.1 3-hydroxyacyl-CoA dehydrogenase family protein [Bacteroidia bacterium]
MNYTERLQNVAVLGAAGKMGSGILLLTALEMADLSLMPENKDKTFALHAVDISSKALSDLMIYIKTQVVKAAEKKAVQLRKVYADRADLVENYDIIDQYVFDVMNIIRPVTRIEVAYDCSLIFEAIKEDPALKIKIFSTIEKNNPNQPWYYTNTSSIPITQLDKEAGLGGRILGVHFYNPPAVQKLVEVIRAEKTQDEVNNFAYEYIKRLKKIAVPSNDFAGFIGNGHFMRDALYGINEAKKLTKEMSWVEAVYCINKVTQDYLIRPMGIFQLIDYVGIDVCSYIMSVMNPHLKDEDLHSDVLDKMIELGVLGGQFSSGAQKDGFLKYEKGGPVAVYDMEKKAYVPFAEFQAKCDAWLGEMPSSWKPWKSVNFNKKKDTVLAEYFAELKSMESNGAKLAKAYHLNSKAIGEKLFNDKVANSLEDVNTVLMTGFYHAYGPINNFL